jgi:hypothetical protein
VPRRQPLSGAAPFRRKEVDNEKLANEAAADVDFPAYFYGPGGQARVFNAAAEVPAGWADHPTKVKEPNVIDVRGGVPHIKAITKAEISEKLEKLGVEHNPRWSEQRLYDMLVKAVTEQKG